MSEELNAVREMVVGVDEVGRGPLIGPVVAAAVVLPDNHAIVGLADSKKLTPKRREKLAIEIKSKAVVWAISEASEQEIDAINILQASLLAMQRAVEKAQSIVSRDSEAVITKALIDGNKIPKLNIAAEAIVKGDTKIEEISAASIIAKVARDKMMVELDALYPEYGFASHKGYPTKQHFAALAKYGVLPQHRRSFSPVRKVIESLVR